MLYYGKRILCWLEVTALQMRELCVVFANRVELFGGSLTTISKLRETNTVIIQMLVLDLTYILPNKQAMEIYSCQSSDHAPSLPFLLVA